MITKDNIFCVFLYRQCSMSNLIKIILLDIKCTIIPGMTNHFIFISIGPITFECINLLWVSSSLVNTADNRLSKNMRHTLDTTFANQIISKILIIITDVMSNMYGSKNVACKILLHKYINILLFYIDYKQYSIMFV